MRKVCVITGSRAEYGLLYCTLKAIEADPDLQLLLCATGSHLSPRFGNTVDSIVDDGFQVDWKADIDIDGLDPASVGRSVGTAIAELSSGFIELRPDLILLVGDRYEALAAAIAATLCGVPTAHCHGGEATLGSMDDSFRHAITKLAHLHFVATEDYGKRVIQMGEEPSNVFVVGALGIENLRKHRMLGQQELRGAGILIHDHSLLVTFHPETREEARDQLKQLLLALGELKQMTIITMPNADVGSDHVMNELQLFADANKGWVQLFTSLGQQRYLSVMKYCDAVVGNSSSGIIEAPSLGRPTVNIGTRQSGRIKASSVIDCEADKDSIVSAIRQALTPEFKSLSANCINPYDHGDSSRQIVEVLKATNLKGLLKKRFHDIN